MKNVNFVVLISMAILLGINACSPQVDKTEEVKVDLEASKKEAKVVIDQFKEFWETENMDLLSKIMSHDSDMVNYGSDAAEHFVGWEGLKNAFEQMLPVLDSTKISIQDQVINIDQSGNFAWFSQIWNWDFSVQGNPMKLDGQRLSGVLEKRDGQWVIVQFHNSVPVKSE